MREPYIIRDLISDLSKQDPDAPVLFAYWTPDIFDLTNDQFAQAIQDADLEGVVYANEEVADLVQAWKNEQEEDN